MGAGIQLYNILDWVLQQTNKAHVTVVTFSISEEFIRKIYLLQKADLIADITVIIDFKAMQKTHKIEKFAGNVFSEMYYARTHAKLVLIQNENHKVAIVGSQNFTKGNREENGVVTNDINSFNTYIAEVVRIKASAAKYDYSNIEKQPIPVIKKSRLHLQHFTFSTCNAMRVTNKIHFFALFNNINIDLEFLKSRPEHTDMFIIPLVNFIKDNNVKQIVYAPAGARTAKNGFHFVTVLLQKCQQYADFEMIDAFENVNNHIKLKTTQIFSPTAWLFDDIVTRGNTINRMVKLTQIENKLILICNN